jgi:hypothetical protein
MFLRVLDAFDEDTKHAQQYSAIAAPWAAAISAAFARSKGAGAGKGGLQAADARVGIELRLPGKSLADADNGPRMSPFEGNRCTRLRRLLALAVHGSEAARQGLCLRHANVRDAELALVGSWALANSKRRALPPGITWFPPCSWQALRERYRESDVFVFPSFSDGFGLVLLEAMACGLPAIASEASIGPEVITANCGFVTPPGDLDRLVQLLRWFDRHRDELPAMSRSARAQTERYTWSNYRSLIMRAVSKLV